MFNSLNIHKNNNIEQSCYGNRMLKLQETVIDGNVIELKRMLEEETSDRDWEWRGKERKTTLELAIILGHSDIVTLLVNAGASPNQLSVSGYSSLHCACIWGQLDCLKQLVRSGANHQLITKSGQTPCNLALYYGHSTCAEYLCCTEARYQLSQAIETTKATLCNTDLITGKWNKDDKVKVNALCNEKTEWLAQNIDCSEKEVTDHTTDFHLRMKPHLNKLEPQHN